MFIDSTRRSNICEGYIAYVPQKFATKSTLPREFWKSEPTRPGMCVPSMCMPDSAEPRACASTVRKFVTPVRGLYRFAVALVGFSYIKKPLLVSVGPWMARLKMALSRLPLEVNAPGSSFEITIPWRGYSLSVVSAKTPVLEERTPYAPSSSLLSGTSYTFSPSRQPLGPLPMSNRFSPSNPTTRDRVFTPRVVLRAVDCDLVKPGGYRYRKHKSPGPSRPWYDERNSKGQTTL